MSVTEILVVLEYLAEASIIGLAIYLAWWIWKVKKLL